MPSLNLIKYAFLEQIEPISTLKTMIWRKYSFQKVTKFPQGNNVPDAHASNTDGCVCRDTCISSTQLKRSIWNKMSLSSP
jgi:hypothetical protein